MEQYFQEYGINDPDVKVQILDEITDVVYDRNQHVIRLDKIDDDYVKKQTLEGIKELDDKIKRIFQKFIKK